ncbi:MAG TPA: LamG-like jellyroll fold domain-containing protein [Nevskiaceae bacterium]|nr:LamG-like jellyroll fold domain-containing protein [Nevskiaceae bacterium]
MKKSLFSRIAIAAITAVYVLCTATVLVPKAHAATPTGDTLNTHAVMVDSSNKLVSWVPQQDQAYDQVIAKAWNYLLHNVPNASNGKPAYYSYSYMNPNTQEPVGWPHNPAGLYGMLIESALNYYAYSGNTEVLTLAKNLADHHLANGMTLATDNWANVPYSSGDSNSLTYHGASYGNSTGVGDGTGVLQPDKIGELGHGFAQLYKQTGDTRYRDAAINAANALASHVRTGNATQSPWPYRVVAQTGAIKEQYTAHVVSPIELFDDMIDMDLGNVASYQTARTTAWNWMMAYPMQNNNWSGYFEDVGYQTDPSANPSTLNALMTARYLLQHPETDAAWQTHSRALITWAENTFGPETYYGARTIREQQIFPFEMGSHTSRYASVNALLYEKTGDAAAKEKAYRSFNWATYMARDNGVVIDGPKVNNQWFTDGYGDYIRHFLVGMASDPSFAPNGQTHLLRSSSVVKSVLYDANQLNYQTFDATGTEVIKVDRVPSTITLGGNPLTQRGDLNAEGWTYDAAGSVLRVRRDTGTSVAVSFSGSPANQFPSVSITSPANNASFAPPASFSLNATASDIDGTMDKIEFYQNSTLVGTSTTAPYSFAVQNLASGSYSFTAKAYDNEGAVTTSAPVLVTVTTLNSGWTDNDVGPVGVAGSSTVSNSTYTVKGSGVDIWDAADSFHFTNTSMTGDGEIKARVVTQQNTDSWALAGVMLRDNLNANSPEVLAALTPTNGFAMDYRTQSGNNTSYVNGGSGAAPNWVRLVRAGNTFTAYKSTNGTSWTSMGSTTVAMGQTVYAGLAVTSHNNNVLGTATFDNVSVTGSADTTGPVISAVSAGSINQNGGTINWTTNEPSNSQIEYGLTTSYGTSTAVNTTMQTAHSQVVSGLDQDTTYHYRVRSVDAAGNASVSGDFTFHTQPAVDTTAPTVPANVVATANSTTQATVTWTASTDNVGVSNYTVLRDGASVGTATGTSFVNTGLTPGQTYVYSVVANDAAGNFSTPSDTASVTLPTPDTQAPTASITAPANGATLTGTVNVTATAADNIGVAGVQFKLDGNNLGSEDTTSPYQTSWNTVNSVNGTHTLTAVARDAAGNTVTTASVTVTVQNIINLTGLVASYNFDEGSGTTLTDRTGNSHAGTISGATWSTTGKYGKALSFDGTNDWVTVADANDLDLTNAMTFEAWVKPSSVTSWRTVLMKEKSGGMAYGLYAASGNSKASFYGNVTSDVAANGTANTSTTAWTHLAGTYDGANLRLYVNGTLVATKALSGNLATTTGVLRIGGNAAWGEYYKGLMDDIRIYNKVLTATEIQTDMNTAVQ